MTMYKCNAERTKLERKTRIKKKHCGPDEDHLVVEVQVDELDVTEDEQVLVIVKKLFVKVVPMKVWVDANPTKAVYVTEAEDAATLPITEKRTIAEAEYIAVIFGLTKVMNFNGDVEILCDREHVPRQLSREWHIKEDHLRKLAESAWKIVAHRKVRGYETIFTWIPRKENRAGKMLK